MKRKYTLFNFSTGDFKGVEDYLNRQAAKGWRLDRVGLLLGRFVEAERDDLRWCVDLIDPKRPREETEEYLELCAEGGWDLVAQTNGMYLFCSRPGLRPAPVQTDPILEKSNCNRYYIKHTILSAIPVAFYLAVLILLNWAMGRDTTGALTLLRYQWFQSWTVSGLILALPLIGLCALWKLLAFAAAILRGRGEQLRPPRRWAMWTTAVANALQVMAALLLILVPYGLDVALTATGNPVTLVILLGGWGLFLLYRAFMLEKDIFPRERRNHIRLGLVCLALMMATILASVFTPFGQRSSYRDETAAAAWLTEDVPLVRAEELSPALPELSFFVVERSLTPMGLRWQLDNYFTGGSVEMTGCETYRCLFPAQARLVARAMAEGALQAVDLDDLRWSTGVDAMERMELDWADEVWYGCRSGGSEAGAVTSVLVVRVGRQAACLSAPIDLWTEPALLALRQALT